MISKITELFIGTVHAQDYRNWFDVLDPFKIPGQGGSAKLTFSEVVGDVVTWVLAIVTIIAFVYLIISGVNYITAGGDAEKATKARTGILNAIIGIIVVVLSYFILRFAANLGVNLGTSR